MVGLLGLAVAVALVVVPAAAAHYPSVIASLDCNGTVTYTVTADIQGSSRNNAYVAIFDTSGMSQPAASGVFGQLNNWSFSGSYTISTSVITDTLTPEALDSWGDGYHPTNGTPVTITRPSTCTSLTTNLSSSTITAGGSVDDSASLVDATSSAGGTVTYTLYADSVCATLSSTPALSQTVTVANGLVPSTSSVTFPDAGTYYWQAVYSGDAKNDPATSPCSSEPLSVVAPDVPPPTQSTTISTTQTTTSTLTPTTSTAARTPVPGFVQRPASVPVSPSSRPLPTVPAPGSVTSTAAGHPAITIVKDPKAQLVVADGTARFEITVTNTGDVSLTDVTVVDPLSTNCDRSLGTLDSGISHSYSCSRPHLTTGFTNTAHATGKPPNGPNVSDRDSATVEVALFRPPSPNVMKPAPPVPPGAGSSTNRNATSTTVTSTGTNPAPSTPEGAPTFVSHDQPQTAG